MGLRFDLRAANWVAYLITPRAKIPRLQHRGEEVEVLRQFLATMESNFYSSAEGRNDLRLRAGGAHRALVELASDWDQSPREVRVRQALAAVRGYFSRMRWTALIIPSSRRSPIDELLSSAQFLREVVAIRPNDPGLVLQLADPPPGRFSLTDVFPSFKTALAESSRWPGVLLWTPDGDSAFFPLPEDRQAIYERVTWLAAGLAATLGLDLGLLRTEYERDFPDAKHSPSEVTLIHLSDTHFGSTEAATRSIRLQQLIRNLIVELGNDRRLIFAVTGDLMHNPEIRNVDAVRGFMDFLANLGGEGLFTCPGNHDVRHDGFLAQELGMVMQLPQVNAQVTWLDDRKVGIVVFNSVIDNSVLARGRIGERQMNDIANEIDRKHGSKEYRLIGMLHHHPVPVQKPDWYSRPFYERLFPRAFAWTEALADSREFADFVDQRRFWCLIHGHKHIPHISATPGGTAVLGCGSSVGRISTTDRSIYMSYNVITLETTTGKITARLLAERAVGGGLRQEQRHELMLVE